MKPKPAVDPEWTTGLAPGRRCPHRRLFGLLLTLAVLVGLSVVVHADQGRPRRGAPGPLVPVPSPSPPLFLPPEAIEPPPADRSVLQAPEGIDDAMIITARPGIDEGMIVAPGRLVKGRTLGAPVPWRPAPSPFVPLRPRPGPAPRR